MKNLKTLLALLLAFVMLFAFAACDSEPEIDGSTPTATDPVAVTVPETTEPEPTIAPVTIGDITIEYESAVLYSPYEDGFATLLVYYNITNNSTEPVKPGKIVFSQAKRDGNNVSASSYKEEDRPELYNSFYNEIAPGETARCMEIFSDGHKGGVYEITVMDMYHKIQEKLIITIDTADLKTVTEA